ncbi:MAG: sugar ABC transporter substrate-binding protein [Firmicutes bacterium]|nr:sugar ABC transporter substrate-binding protein [Bacillota bacterium]
MKASRLLLAGLFVLLLSCGVGAQTVVQIASYGGSPAVLQRIMDEFNATHPHIRVEVQVFPQSEYIDKMYTMIMGGVSPDIVQTWAQYKSTWVDQGLLLDLTDRWNNSPVIREMDIYPFMMDTATYQGRIYGVPYDFNVEVFFLNYDWFQERGVALPNENWTVYDHAELAKKLTDPMKGVYGTYNQPRNGGYRHLQWMLNWTGHGWVSDDGTEVLVDRQEHIEMLEYWYDLERNYDASPYPGSFQRRGDLLGGGYAMWQHWLSSAFQFSDPPAYDWRLTVYPAAPKGQKDFAQGHMFSIPATAKNVDAAWEVLEWMASYKGQQVIVREAKRQPIGPYSELWEEFFGALPRDKAAYVQEFLLYVLYGNDYVNAFEYWDTYAEMNAVMTEALRNIFNDQKAIPGEMANAAQRMRAILAEKR